MALRLWQASHPCIQFTHQLNRPLNLPAQPLDASSNSGTTPVLKAKDLLYGTRQIVRALRPAREIAPEFTLQPKSCRAHLAIECRVVAQLCTLVMRHHVLACSLACNIHCSLDLLRFRRSAIPCADSALQLAEAGDRNWPVRVQPIRHRRSAAAFLMRVNHQRQQLTGLN